MDETGALRSDLSQKQNLLLRILARGEAPYPCKLDITGVRRRVDGMYITCVFFYPILVIRRRSFDLFFHLRCILPFRSTQPFTLLCSTVRYVLVVVVLGLPTVHSIVGRVPFHPNTHRTPFQIGATHTVANYDATIPVQARPGPSSSDRLDCQRESNSLASAPILTINLQDFSYPLFFPVLSPPPPPPSRQAFSLTT